MQITEDTLLFLVCRRIGTKHHSIAASMECTWPVFPRKRKMIDSRSTYETLVISFSPSIQFDWEFSFFLSNFAIFTLFSPLKPDAGYGNEHFWTSGTDLADEGNFFWMANGKPITFTNWNAGEPNNFRYENGEEENCLELWNRDGKGLKWNDSPCSFETYFVCEA